MTDKQKAIELSIKVMGNGHFECNGVCQRKQIANALTEMAEWKDREIAMLLLNINDMIADCKGHECIKFISDYLKMICEKYCKEKVRENE